MVGSCIISIYDGDIDVAKVICIYLKNRKRKSTAFMTIPSLNIPSEVPQQPEK